MATTYGYGGEFSSDEDVDRIEQQAERIIQSRFNDNTNARPSVRQIEETIEAIKNLSPEEDISLTDDLLAGLLDHFKTQRGPIVDSTRKLYKKIVVRIIRESSKQHDNETNGNSNHNTVSNNNNINDVDLVALKQKPALIDSFSSDEEEPLVPIAPGTLKKRLDVGAINLDKEDEVEEVDEMDIDSEIPIGPARETKQVDISTDDEDNVDNSVSSEESASDEHNDESDVLNVTPIKPSVINNEKARVAVSALSTPKRAQTDSSVKRQPLAQSTPKGAGISTAKKPYTRSQRQAAARALTSNDKASDSFVGTKSTATASSTSQRVSRRRLLILAMAAIFVALLAFLIFQYRTKFFKTSAVGGRQLFGSNVNFG